MKTFLLIVILLISLSNFVDGQDTTKVQIAFQTKSNQPIKILQRVYLGEINTEGWVGDHYAIQQGSLTRSDFLFNAPNTGCFDENKQVQLIMTDDHSYRMQFMVYTGTKNQKWLLSPPGIDYNQSLKECRWGGSGIFVSSLLLVTAVVATIIENANYKSDLNIYNFQKTNHFPDVGAAPTRPSVGTLYLIPAMTFAISIPIYAHGRHLYTQNKASAIQIE